MEKPIQFITVLITTYSIKRLFPPNGKLLPPARIKLFYKNGFQQTENPFHIQNNVLL